MRREDCILFSGGATGTEAAFGAAAQRHGIDEVNFTFEGHNPVRERGRRILTGAELRRGDVGLGYLSKLMHRKYPDTPLFPGDLLSDCTHVVKRMRYPLTTWPQLHLTVDERRGERPTSSPARVVSAAHLTGVHFQ